MPPVPSSAVIESVKAHRGLVVLRGFDDSGGCQFWLVDMSAAELESWWTNRDSFWHATTPEEAILAKAFGEEPPAPRPPMVLPGQFLNANTNEELEFWRGLSSGKAHYYCQICCDDDSLLVTPHKRRLYHRGYTDSRHDLVAIR